VGDLETRLTWRAVGLNGHREVFGNEFLYTSEDAPVEADEYARMTQRADNLLVERDALTREVAGLRYYIAQLERNVTQEERAYAAGVASLMLSAQEAQP